MYSRKRLKAALALEGMNQADLAEALGITRVTMSYKATGRREFTVSEIQQIRETLHLSDEQMISIFFADDVD